jgi:hypothetical protein
LAQGVFPHDDGGETGQAQHPHREHHQRHQGFDERKARLVVCR